MRWLHHSPKDHITEGNVLRAIGLLSVPMLVSAVLQNLQSLINLFWVGRLGPEAVAGVAMSGTVLMVLFPMLMGLCTGTTALVARAVGAGRDADASAATTQSIMSSLVLGLLSGAVGWVFADPLLHLLGAGPEVMADGSAYLKISLLGSFTVFVLFIGNAALQGAGDVVTPMIVMAIANVINIGLDPLFIFGLGPFPRMGVAGAAWATVLSQAIAALLSLRVLMKGNGRLHLHRAHWKPDFNLTWRILRIGIPGSGQMLSRSLMAAVMMRIVAACGTAAIAAYGTGMRFHMIFLMPAFALGGTAATMVGQNLGAGKPERARHAAWVAVGIDAIIMVVAAAVMMAFASAIIGFFNNDANVVRIGTEYLWIVSPFYVFAAIGIVLGRALNGAGDSMFPMFITILSLWGLQVPLAIALSHIWQPPTAGIWWAMSASIFLQGVLTAAWFETGRWKKARV